MKFLCVFLITSLISLGSFAQGSATGCLIPSQNIVYQTPEDALVNAVLKLLLGGNPSYSAASGVSLSSNYCSWTPNPSGSFNCGVCTTYTFNILGLVNGCQSGALLEGYVGTYTMVECNLDDHSWLFGAAAGVFGIFIIRKRNKP
ncbi:hypothetical protein [Pedobacter kyungheensis]|uniref:hypothetical protein n=1 Tax=Pedobacter kyungheensis TaxID=1069985 RepID=UPI0012DFFC1B|nr:hypothetical protein [Pedobacter kyungheensis]